MIVVAVAVGKVSVCAAGIINMVVVVEVSVIAVLADARIMLVDVIVIVSQLALTLSYSVDMSSDELADVMIDTLSGIEIEELADVNASVIAVVMTALDFPVSTPLQGFSR